MSVTILGLGGSLRAGSTTTLALHIALAGAREAGAQTRLIDLATLCLPLFDGTYSLDGYAPADRAAMTTLLDAADEAHGVILASPTYHGTISGALKNALDILEVATDDAGSRLGGKVAGLMAVQGGTSGTGVNTLTTMLLAARAMGAWVAPTMVSIPGSREAFDDAGVASSSDIDRRLRALGAEVARASALHATPWSERAARDTVDDGWLTQPTGFPLIVGESLGVSWPGKAELARRRGPTGARAVQVDNTTTERQEGAWRANASR